MKFKLIASFAISLLLFLVNCSSQSLVSQTPTLTAKPSFTYSPNPTATINSTFTPFPTFSPAQETETAIHASVVEAMQTHEYFMNTSNPATLEARNVKCKDGFGLELGLDVVRMSNDEWTVFTCSPRPKNRNEYWTPGVVNFGTRYTQIIKTDLSKTWIIQHNTFDYSVIDRPDAFLSPLRWTADGKYLYLSPQYYPGGSGGYTTNMFRTGRNDIYRINLETGEFKLVLPKTEFDALSMSPNDQYLIYSHWDKPETIYIKNVENDETSQIKLLEDIIASGLFIWNSESTRVTFVTAHGIKKPSSGDDTSSTSIFVLTLRNMHVQKILSKDPRIFIVSDGCNDNNVWLDENTICLYSLNDEFESWNSYFTLNIKTGVVKFLRPFP